MLCIHVQPRVQQRNEHAKKLAVPAMPTLWDQREHALRSPEEQKKAEAKKEEPAKKDWDFNFDDKPKEPAKK